LVKKLKKQTRAGAAGTVRRRQKPEIKDEEEQVLRAATRFLVQKHGMFLVATGARKLSIRGLPAWVITVTLRYDRGHEGYLGDLLFDGEQFTFLTEQSVMDERARKVAGDPEGLRKWNEYRASTLHPGER
jgi:hypothetical protein